MTGCALQRDLPIRTLLVVTGEALVNSRNQHIDARSGSWRGMAGNTARISADAVLYEMYMVIEPRIEKKIVR